MKRKMRKIKTLAVVTIALSLGTMLLTEASVSAESGPEPLVRLAELEIDAAHLDAYKTALREEIEASIRLEPGVLKLYAVAVKDHPDQIRLFEMYATTAAYEAHLRSEHFMKYKRATSGMVRSLRLVETEPILLGAK